MKVLFLDIDGVLNSVEYRRSPRYREAPDYPATLLGARLIDPRAVEILEDVCWRTHCSIVVSSAWRDLAPFRRIGKMLELRGAKATRIIDRTPLRSELTGEYAVYASPIGADRIVPRGYEICQWLRDHPVESYAIVDDDDDMVSIHEHRTREFGERFVQTDLECGLIAEDGERLVKILSTPLGEIR